MPRPRFTLSNLYSWCTGAGPEGVQKYLVHAHTRLLEIGQRMDDPFAESFHRGVGMLILVKEQDKNPDRDDGFCEEMLCKSLRAFNDARGAELRAIMREGLSGGSVPADRQ